MSLLDKASLCVTPNGYKENILYSVVPNTTLGDMDVVRATTATRINSLGLIEVVPRNLITYSEQIDNADWIKTNVTVTANATTAPNGTLTAEKLIPTTTNDLHITESSLVSFVSGNSYTFSFYAKRAENNFIQITASSSLLSTRANFNLLNGTLGTVDSGITATITLIDNEWYRCTASFVASATGNFRMILTNITASTSARFVTFAGNGTSGVFVWGCQVEQGSTATEYFPTTTRLNIPRIDYTNGSCPSLLVEPQRTNLLTYSNDFSNGIWINSGATITPNSIISPDGTLNATKLTILSGQYLYQLISVTASNVYTISVYVKVLSGTKQFKFNVFGGGNNFTSSAYTATTQWQRFNYTFTASGTGGAGIYPILVDGLAGGDFYIYGSQTEQGSYATSLIPTQGSSVTRNADVISKTGISSLIGQTEGTVFFDVYRKNSNSEFFLMVANSIGANAYLNSIYFYQTSASVLIAEVFVSGILQARITTASGLSVGKHKIALGYKQNDFILYVDGVQIGTDTSGNIPTLSALEINGVDGGFTSSVGINSAQLYKTKLSNTEIAQLTTI
jgi:hypothetical protein